MHSTKTNKILEVSSITLKAIYNNCKMRDIKGVGMYELL